MGIKPFLSKYLFLISGLVLIFSALILGFYTTNKTTPSIQNPSPVPQKTQQIIPTTPPDKQIQGQIIVKFKKEYTPSQITEHIKMYEATIIKQIGGINYTVIKVPAGKENEIINKMKLDPYVEKAQPDFTNHTTFVPNDPSINAQYFLNNTGQTINGVTGTVNADVRAEPAWDITRGGGVRIAILDSGIDVNHPELSSKIVSQRVFASTTIDPDIQDRNGHGTHVAGIIAATTNNGTGGAGTCPDCLLIIGKVVTNDINGDATGSTSDITSGITWAADQGAKVINLSLRTTTSGSAPLYQSAIDYAMSKGTVVVVAAGNDSTSSQVWPAANNNVISVAATDNRDQMASFSNYGSYVRVAAPGINIFSTLPTTTNSKDILNYGYSSGTSMASPVVAGVTALVWASPFGTSPTNVMNRIFTTADKISGTGTYWTEGRVNAMKAVGADITPTTAATPTLFPSIYCMGGSGVPPCATIYPTATTVPTEIPSVYPTESTTINPSVSDNISQEPTISQETTPQPTSTLPINNADLDKLISQLCPALSTSNYISANDNTIQHHKHHRKHHRHGHNGWFSRMLEMIIKLIEELLHQLGIENPCVIQSIQKK